MRMSKENENLIGKVCVCSVGRPFIVTGRSEITISNKEDNTVLEGWCGLGLDGQGTAFSSDPCVIAESGQEFHDKLMSRFKGKMAYSC